MLPSAFGTVLPNAAGVTLIRPIGSPSGSESLASTAIVTALPWLVLALSSSAIGGRLPANTVMLTLALANPPCPSLML